MSKWIKSIEQLPTVIDGKLESNKVLVKDINNNIGIGVFYPQTGWSVTWHDRITNMGAMMLVEEWRTIGD